MGERPKTPLELGFRMKNDEDDDDSEEETKPRESILDPEQKEFVEKLQNQIKEAMDTHEEFCDLLTDFRIKAFGGRSPVEQQQVAGLIHETAEKLSSTINKAYESLGTFLPKTDSSEIFPEKLPQIHANVNAANDGTETIDSMLEIPLSIVSAHLIDIEKGIRKILKGNTQEILKNEISIDIYKVKEYAKVIKEGFTVWRQKKAAN
jgi:hypothetical protein